MVKDRSKDGKQTPEFIIHTAKDLFMQLGYRSVSTRQIADACGITQPALYHHFRGKKELYVEVIRTVLAETENELRLIAVKEEDIHQKMQRLFRYFMTHHQYDIAMMTHDVVHQFDEETRLLINQWWMKSFLEPVVTLISTAVHQGEIKDPSTLDTTVVELSFMILTMIKSSIDPVVMSRIPASQQEAEIQRQSRLYVDLILKGLGT